jgi:threonine synthase
LRLNKEQQVDWSHVIVDEVRATTVADSISVNRPRDGLAAVRAVIQSGGEAIAVSDREILNAVPEMARATGVFPEPAAAAPWAAVKQMVRDETIDKDELIVCLVTGSGLKDAAAAAEAAGAVQVIDPSLDAVRASKCLPFPG